MGEGSKLVRGEEKEQRSSLAATYGSSARGEGREGNGGEGVQGGITVGIVFNVSLTAHISPVRLCDC